MQGAHKGYQLQAADLTCSALSELSVYNVRRLFANRGYEAMDLRHQFVGKKPTEGRWPKIANAVIDPSSDGPLTCTVELGCQESLYNSSGMSA